MEEKILDMLEELCGDEIVKEDRDIDLLEEGLIDSLDYVEFLKGETRFESLRRTFPDHADVLFAQAKEEAARNYHNYKEQEKH